MFFIKDIIFAAAIVNVITSTISLYFFYKLTELCFNKQNAIISSIIFCVFPFQAWLGMSGLPESTAYCFIIAGIYYFILWYKFQNHKILFVSSVLFALANGFRYESWFFTGTFILFVFIISLRQKDFKEVLKNSGIALISIITIGWWLIQNYIDHKDAFYFITETAKIYDQFNTAGFLQKLVQYPVFVFYTAPLTAVFSFKIIYESFKGKEFTLEKVYIWFNLLQLLLLIIQGVIGTGGTNMMSRYIILNAILLIPLSVKQALEFRKIFAVSVISVFVVINIIWSFYYPQPYREDTFEVGNTIRYLIEKKYIGEKENIYFEEDPGYLYIWAIKSLSNHPEKIVLGTFPLMKKQDRKGRRKTELTDDELNILEIKQYLEKNNINTAIVRSDSYTEKLNKLSIRNEQIGDYKIFYLKENSSSINDSSISSFSKNITRMNNNPDMIFYGGLLGLSNYVVDNTNLGMNPQTIILEWTASNPKLLDSLEYEEYGLERYRSIIRIKTIDSDSTVYTITNKIFSDRNLEELIETNRIKNIIVLKPFALLQYSRKYGKSPFDGGIYNLELSIYDEKFKNELLVFRGENKYARDKIIFKDTLITKVADSLNIKVDTSKVKQRLQVTQRDSINYSYNLGSIIAMFPDSDYKKIVEKRSDFARIALTYSLQSILSQRYQADHILNWVFTYF